MGIPNNITSSWEICMQVKKLQLELDFEQNTGSNLGKEYIKAASSCLFNVYAEYIMWNVELDEEQARIKIAGENINNLRFADWKVVAEPWKTLGFLASRGEEFNPGPVMWLDHSELLCNKVLLKYKRDTESFWHRQQKGEERTPPHPHPPSLKQEVIYLLAGC